MSSGYTIEDFNDELGDLALGINTEQECLEFYRQSVGQVDDLRVKELYQWFATVGEARIATLREIQTATIAANSWDSGITAQSKANDALAGDPPAFDASREGMPGQAEIITIRQAAELEKKAASVYYTAVQRSRDKTVRELWRHLAASEGTHIQLLDSYFVGLMQLARKKKKKKKTK